MRTNTKKAFALIEYALLMVLIISAFLVMRHYIQRGLFGKWGESGQSFAYGRQYDPQKTIECSFDQQSNLWYDRNCFQYWTANEQCNGDTVCEEAIITNTCSNSYCSQLNNGAMP